MPVAELMRILQTYPPDMRVVADGYEEGYDDLEEDLVAVREMRLDASEKWWEGQHGDADGARREGGGAVKALALRRPNKAGR